SASSTKAADDAEAIALVDRHMHEPGERVFGLRQFGGEDLRGLVLRAVVDEHDLDAARVAEHFTEAADEPGQIARFVVARNHDREIHPYNLLNLASQFAASHGGSPMFRFVALHPDRDLWDRLSRHKEKVLSAAGPQLYLDHPPHLTVYLADFADDIHLL